MRETKTVKHPAFKEPTTYEKATIVKVHPRTYEIDGSTEGVQSHIDKNVCLCSKGTMFNVGDIIWCRKGWIQDY